MSAEEAQNGQAAKLQTLPQVVGQQPDNSRLQSLPVVAVGTPDAAVGSDGQSAAPTLFEPTFSIKDKPQRRRKLMVALVSVAVVLVVLAAAYVGLGFYFNDHFGFNTTINDANCTFKTVAEVQEIISTQVDKYQITIQGRGGSNEYIQGKDVDLAYSPDNQVAEILAGQNPFLWPARIFSNPEDSTTLASVRLDSGKLRQLVGQLEVLKPEQQVEPTNAFMEYVNGRWTVHPETLGTTLDEQATYDAIYDAMRNTSSTIDLDKAGCYVQPQWVSADPEFATLVSDWNTYVPFCVIYEVGDESVQLDGWTTMGWVVHNDDGSFTYNNDAIKAWVSDFAKRYDTVGGTRNFKDADGKDVEVSGGNYGWELDQAGEVEAIKYVIEHKMGETREPYYIQTAVSRTEAEWGKTYIELNLTTQYMWMFEDGKVIFESDVVTGLPGSRATPQGVYNVLEKLSPTVLRGDLLPDGTREYESPVSYWMRITWSGVGFHDATWQPAFGGSRYTYAGSHGCINMPLSKARELYGLVYIGLPVISHY
jgi:hypothetical protein